MAIRTDSSTRIGGGHVVRCMTLAAELRGRGADIKFICRELPGNLISRIRESGYDVAALPMSREFGDEHGSDREGGFDSRQRMDAGQTAAATSGTTYDWLIEDHYRLASTWEAIVRPCAARLLVIDDLADRPHHCDMLVDPTYGGSGDRYAGLVNGDATMLCGSRYALLRQQFLAHRPTSPKRFDAAKPLIVHVFFGSADAGGHTCRFSELLLEHFPDLQVRAVVGTAGAFGDRLRGMQRRYGDRFDWRESVDDMAASMRTCDVAIGAPGGATWERASLGLPSVYLAVAANQETILQRLSADGLCRYLGAANTLTGDAFVAEMRAFLSDGPALEDYSRRGMLAVDVKGASRVADAMERLR